MTNLIDFEKFFNEISAEEYVVVKLPSRFPSLSLGSDLDIYCRDIDFVSQKAVEFLSAYVCEDSFIEIDRDDNRNHIDLIRGKKIVVRFDLVSELPKYSNISIKKSFFDVIIENRKKLILRSSFSVNVPDLVDEAVLRYLEYIEYVPTRADKIKHLEFIVAKINCDPQMREEFFRRFHYFVASPTPRYDGKSLKRRFEEKLVYIFEMKKKSLNLLRRDGFKMFIIRAVKLFYKK